MVVRPDAETPEFQRKDRVGSRVRARGRDEVRAGRSRAGGFGMRRCWRRRCRCRLRRRCSCSPGSRAARRREPVRQADPTAEGALLTVVLDLLRRLAAAHLQRGPEQAGRHDVGAVALLDHVLGEGLRIGDDSRLGGRSGGKDRAGLRGPHRRHDEHRCDKRPVRRSGLRDPLASEPIRSATARSLACNATASAVSLQLQMQIRDT